MMPNYDPRYDDVSSYEYDLRYDRAPGQKASTVNTSTLIRDSLRKAEQLERQAAKLREAVKNAADLPDEPPKGSILTFKKVLNRTTYHYAAFRSPAGWAITGRETATRWSWDQLIDFVGSDAWPSISIVREGW